MAVQARSAFLLGISEGPWAAEISCYSFGYRSAFSSNVRFVSVSGNTFYLEHGERGNPVSFQLSGTVEADGRLQLAGDGVAAGRGTRGSGQPYKAAFDGKFADARYEGAGQLGGQQCTLKISRAQ
jgi:hypothetical protein